MSEVKFTGVVRPPNDCTANWEGRGIKVPPHPLKGTQAFAWND